MRWMFISLCLIGLASAPVFGQQPKEKVALTLNAMGHIGPVTKVLFTPDNKQAISVSRDGTIRFWDTETGEHLRMLTPPTERGKDSILRAAALSPDGKLLAVAGISSIYVVALPEGTLHKTLDARGVIALAFSKEGKLASGGGDAIFRVWDPQKGVKEREFDQSDKKLVTDNSRSLAFSPDGKRLLACASSARNIWDLTTGAKVASLQGPNILRWIDWHPKGDTIVGQANSATLPVTLLHRWKTDGTPLPVLEGTKLSARSLPDGNLLVLNTSAKGAASAFYNETREVRILDPGTNKTTLVLALYGDAVKNDRFRELDVSPDGSLAAIYGTIGTDPAGNNIMLVRATEKARGPLLGQTFPVGGNSTGFNEKGNSIASFRRPSGFFRFFDLEKLAMRAIPIKKVDLKNEIYRHGPDEEGRSLKLQSGNKGDLLTIMQKEKVLAKVAIPGTAIKAKKFSNVALSTATFVGNENVAVGTQFGQLLSFDAETGKLLRRIQAHTGKILDIKPSKDGRYVVSQGNDHLLCVWNISQDRPLLFLFIPAGFLGKQHENDWVAWTPDGYYAASPGGEKLIGWTVDRGPEQMADFVPADRFRKQFHRPDVIRRLLEFGSLEKALEAADNERGIKSTRVPLEDALPPAVTLIAPTVLTEAKVTIKAKAVNQGKFPITELQLLLDGRPFQGGVFKVEPPKFGTVETSWTIETPPGKHQLSVVARTAVSSGLSPEIEVNYEASKALDVRPALYVLSIGINTYPGDWKLNCARNDAEKIALTFLKRSKAIYRDVQAKIVLDNDATRSGILDGFTWLKKQMKAQDVAIIFFAGHGTREKGNFYLMPRDVDMDNLAKTGVSGEELKSRLANMPGRVLMLLDACHSGAIGAKGGLTAELTRDLSDDDCGVIVMCAAMGREEAGEERKLGHGYFALALIEALSGKADVSRRDGAVYLHHLDQYVNERVVELSNDEQHPVSGRPTTVRSFALAKP